MKRITIIVIPVVLLSVIAVLIFQIISNDAKTPKGKTGKDRLVIVTSFYPLAEFSAQVGGDKVNVIKVTPAGVSPHDYEPTAREFEQIDNADIFIFNGAGFDPWAERFSKTLKKKNIESIEMTKHFKLLDNSNPHIWLDPVLVQKQVEIIMNALAELDPDSRDYYKKRASNYIGKLRELDGKYSDELNNCEIRSALASHSAFNYLAKRYDIEFYSVSLSPNDEPSSREIAGLTELAKKENIKYIFFETLVSPKIAKTIAQEAGIKTLVLNPAEGLTEEEIAARVDYIQIMEKNLGNLSLALGCKNE